MEKAKLMMEKMGWNEGKGLGKDESGITKSIRPNYQTTKIGFGYDTKKDNFWWEDAFNEAAKNINVSVDQPLTKPKNKKHQCCSIKCDMGIGCKSLKSIHKSKKKNCMFAGKDILTDGVCNVGVSENKITRVKKKKKKKKRENEEDLCL